MPASAGVPAESLDIGEALRRLRAGGILAVPTETLLGLLADPARPEALARLSDLKGRPADAPFPLIAPTREAAWELAAAVDPAERRAAERFWPGPLTLLLRARPGLPAALVSAAGRVAVRVPGASPAADLVRRHGAPLTATSANFRGAPPPASAEELDPALRALLDGVMAGRSPGGLPSTLAFREGGRWTIVRSGAVPAEGLPEPTGGG